MQTDKMRTFKGTLRNLICILACSFASLQLGIFLSQNDEVTNTNSIILDQRGEQLDTSDIDSVDPVDSIDSLDSTGRMNSISDSHLLNVSDNSVDPENIKRYTALNSVLGKLADKHGVIIVSYVEYGYIDLAINFYLTSIAKWNITNYLMISSDDKSCDVLAKVGVNCVFLMNSIKGTGKASKYGSTDFKAKTFAKTKIVFDALKFDFTVILTDLDIFYLRNPIPLILNESKNYDLTIQRNDKGEQANSGFYVARPTPETLYLFAKICQREAQNFKYSEQMIMIELLKSTKTGIKVKYLDSSVYPAGSVFWESKQRMFIYKDPQIDSSYKEVIAHNNWMVGKDAKIYRFKESLMWRYDKDGYYSDTSAKYLMFDNPFDSDGKVLKSLEKASLLNALSIGYILNRTVIMPTFHCYGCKYAVCNDVHECSFQTHYEISTFDKYYRWRYREHVFLHNPQTPEIIRNSKSPLYLIESQFTADAISKGTMTLSKDVSKYTPQDMDKGATVDEIRKWFGEVKESVLRFHSLYGAFQGFPKNNLYSEIDKTLKSALKGSDYRQY